jgi:lantibiotic transport system permease protein
LALFVLFTLVFGNLLSVMKPELKFNEYHMESTLTEIYFKLFLSSLGILSTQFLLSLLFRDFLKPMGIGFLGTVMGVILVANSWKYAYLFPYSHPMLTIKTIQDGIKSKPGSAGIPQIGVNLLTREIFVSGAIA